jgi:hypothetical protein
MRDAHQASEDDHEPTPHDRLRHRRGWRQWLVVLHRDVGFFAIGLTLIYAVSGIAVNHREDWNYNQSVDQEKRVVGQPSALLGERAGEGGEARLARDRQDALVARLTTALLRAAPPRKAFWRGPDRLSLFFGTGDTDVVDYQPSTGTAEETVKTDRPLVRDMNFLHLNEGRGAWTWIADGFAVLLIFLALSGALIVRGNKGLKGRGGILMVLGMALPIVALFMMR